MRCLIILALAALFASVTQAATAQGDARILADRWKNCSKVIHGRLGALHPEDLLSKESSTFIMTGTNGIDTVTYSPCLLNDGYLLSVGHYQLLGSYDFVQAGLPSLSDYPTTSELVTFKMPTQKGDVPTFTGNYVSVKSISGERHTATVVTLCNPGLNHSVPSALVSIVSNHTKSGNMHFQIVFESREACARFPYTNEGMPPGGVAALVVVILCFVLEFGICAWYHYTHKIETPFTTATDGDVME